MRFDLVPLTAAALKLPRALHARITATLIARRDGTQRDVLAAEWEAELDRREEEIDATSGNLRLAEQVFRVARRQHFSR